MELSNGCLDFGKPGCLNLGFWKAWQVLRAHFVFSQHQHSSWGLFASTPAELLLSCKARPCSRCSQWISVHECAGKRGKYCQNLSQEGSSKESFAKCFILPQLPLSAETFFRTGCFGVISVAGGFPRGFVGMKISKESLRSLIGSLGIL